jgi:glycerophosphoryl diester phosphodiesterase
MAAAEAGRRRPYLDLARPWLVAHRGGAALAPENTLPAFDGAVELGAACLELDVRRTRDGAVVVFHDPDAARITGEPGPVEGRTLAELRRLDAGFSFTPDGGRTFPFRGRAVRIPTLAELLERHPRTRLNIEAKGPEPELARAMVDEIRRAGAVDRVCIGSERDEQGERIRSLLPEACHFLPAGPARRHVLSAWSGLLASRCPRGWDCADLPDRALGLAVGSARVVRHFHRLGMPVFIWTVDDEAEMRRLLAAGVDGIMTDRPDVLARVLREPAPSGSASPGPGP